MGGAQLRRDYQYGSARIAGAAGAMAWATGVIPENGLTRISQGVYQFQIFPSANENEVSLDVTPIMPEARDFTWAARWISRQLLEIRTANSGSPWDFDFYLEINRHRNAIRGETIPPPSPLPPPPPPPGTIANSTADMTLLGVPPFLGTATLEIQLKDGLGNPLALETLLEAVVSDDDAGSSPAANATFGLVAIAGDIKFGGGTNSIILKTDPSGFFSCTIDDPFPETVFLLLSLTFGSAVIDTRQVLPIQFTTP